MNSLERLHHRLRGETVDRLPNFDILMALASHHIGQPLSRFYLEHRVLVDANLAVCKDYELDIVQAISDPYREAADFGLEVEFPADNLPIIILRAGTAAFRRQRKPVSFFMVVDSVKV